MIAELDKTIKQLLIKKGHIEPAEIDISFDIPDREWSASLSRPTVNLYLYDVRENHNLRSTEWIVEKNGNGQATKRKNAKRIDLSYLVTVWTNNIEDQHNLLWQIMLTLFQFPSIPQELLTGKLAEQQYTIITSAAQPDGLLSNPSDFWAALDNEIKPSFNFIATLPMDLGIAFTSSIASTRSISVKPPDAEAEQMIGISGIVHLKDKPEIVIAEAIVVAKEAGMTATTDDQGQYSFSRIPAGKQTILVILPDKKMKESSIKVPSSNYNLAI
jgi:hypothetical protein